MRFFPRIWLGCVNTLHFDSVFARFDAYQFSGTTQILKSTYDFAWTFNGGIVGNAEYDEWLAVCLSSIVTVVDPDGVTIELVETPQEVLEILVSDYNENYEQLGRFCVLRAPIGTNL